MGGLLQSTHKECDVQCRYQQLTRIISISASRCRVLALLHSYNSIQVNRFHYNFLDLTPWGQALSQGFPDAVSPKPVALCTVFVA